MHLTYARTCRFLFSAKWAWLVLKRIGAYPRRWYNNKNKSRIVIHIKRWDLPFTSIASNFLGLQIQLPQIITPSLHENSHDMFWYCGDFAVKRKVTVSFQLEPISGSLSKGATKNKTITVKNWNILVKHNPNTKMWKHICFYYPDLHLKELILYVEK